MRLGIDSCFVTRNKFPDVGASTCISCLLTLTQNREREPKENMCENKLCENNFVFCWDFEQLCELPANVQASGAECCKISY